MSFGLTVSITMVWYDWGDTNGSSFEVDRKKSPGLLTLLLLGHCAENTPAAKHMLLELLPSKGKRRKKKAKFLERRVSSLLMPLSRCRKNSARMLWSGSWKFLIAGPRWLWLMQPR